MSIRIFAMWMAMVAVSWVANAGAQTLPALPNIPDISCTAAGPAASNAVIKVQAGGNFQDALNAAKPGDTILLQAGATYTGNFIAPVKNGTGCITIRSSAPDSALPPAGTRTDPSYASQMPKIVSMGGPAILFPNGAHHYQFMHVEITAGAYVDTLIDVSLVAWGAYHQAAHHIDFDRVYIHGHPTHGTKRGITMNAFPMTVKNSYISDIKADGQDSQAIMGWAGGSGFRIINNYLEASGENIMFGGAPGWYGVEDTYAKVPDDPEHPDSVPADIEIRNNHLFKRHSWRSGAAGFAPAPSGAPWTVKNLLELKNAKRVLIYGNVLENSWWHAQGGFAILLTPGNQNGDHPWTTVKDVTIQCNWIKNTSQGISIKAFGYPYQTQQAQRILIEHNLFTGLGSHNPQGYNQTWLEIRATPKDVTIRHNTASAISAGWMITADGGPASGFTYTDNIGAFGTLGIASIDGHGFGADALNYHFPNARFLRNVLYNSPPFAAGYPKNNDYPGSISLVGFVDPANGNYQLSHSSPYKHAGTDGKDIGVDFDLLAAASYTSPLPVASSRSPSECKECF